MTLAPVPTPAPDAHAQPTLRQVLRRVHLRMTLAAVALAGLAVLVAGTVMIRTYALHNLELVAEATSYTVEAGVVFDDRAAVVEVLARTAANEEIARIAVTGADGRPIGHWQRLAARPRGRLVDRVSAIAFPAPVLASVVHDGATIGTVRVWGDASGLLRFIMLGLGSALLCMALTAVAVTLLARRLQRAIVAPLQRLAAVTHSVRFDRAFDRRVPPSPIAEISSLGDDLNGLLAELEAWQDSVRSENETLAHRANHDSLTGLPNRALFEDRLRKAVRHARATGGEVAVLFLDSDYFKDINDRFGHAAGDTVLVEIAARIRRQLRDGDLVARMGGDEFAVLLAPIGADEPASIVERITASMAAPVILENGTRVTASLSIGIACFPEPCGDEASLLNTADATMYETKRTRRRPDEPGGDAPATAPAPAGVGADVRKTI